jgi:uncharacterized protein involved in exopolysaccharide biosynthesis
VNPKRQNLEKDLADAKVMRRGLQAKYELVNNYATRHTQRLEELREVTAEHQVLERKKKEAEENYLLYAQKTEEARIADALDRQKIANVAIAEGPTLEKIPSKPDTGLLLAVGFLVATLVSFGSPFVKERLRDAVYSPEELEAATGLRTLAALPGGKI